MDEIRGLHASRLSQISDPITRITSDFGSNSAPCSPRLRVRVHESSGSPDDNGGGGGRGGISSGESDGSRSGGGRSDFNVIGSESPRFHSRRICQAPVPPPRPRNKDLNVSPRDSPYVNVQNLLFHKNENSTQAARNAGYVELKDSSNSSSSNSSNCGRSFKCSPYTFTSESSGQVEYADKRLFDLQTNFGQKSFESCKSGDFSLNSPYDVASSSSSSSTPRGGNFERSFSFSNKKHHDATSQLIYSGDNQLFVDKTIPSSASIMDGKKESNFVYSASKSFDGFSNTVEEFNWQERCLELQLELHRSRNQATRIRDMLREKVLCLNNLEF